MGNARQKLNVAYFNGALIVSALFGLIASWFAFWIALAVMIACGVAAGDIRPKPGKRERGRDRPCFGPFGGRGQGGRSADPYHSSH